jgi:cytochrome P450
VRELLAVAMFLPNILDLYPTFWLKTCEVTEKMTALVRTETTEMDKAGVAVDVASWASRVTLDIIGVAGMGHDFNAVEDENSELSRTYRKIISPSREARFAQLLNLLINPRIVAFIPMKRNLQVAEARTIIRRTCFDLIDAKKRDLEKGISGKDILSVAIESGGFSDEDLVNQLMTFLAAGHETTATSMQWACYWLCRNPDMQAKLRAEIRAHLPSPRTPGGMITNADVDGLPYVNAVCNEVLRLTPPVALTLRVADHDSNIQGQFIPRDTSIIMAPWAVNVDKKLWGEDAGAFNPERWIGQGRAHTGGADSNYSFLTFLHGPRSCIGQKFAQAEFACLLAGWLGRFEMEFENKDYALEIAGGITSKPKGLKVRMKVVEGW